MAPQDGQRSQYGGYQGYGRQGSFDRAGDKRDSHWPNDQDEPSAKRNKSGEANSALDLLKQQYEEEERAQPGQQAQALAAAAQAAQVAQAAQAAQAGLTPASLAQAQLSQVTHLDRSNYIFKSKLFIFWKINT